jgi:hypothetical protein
MWCKLAVFLLLVISTLPVCAAGDELPKAKKPPRVEINALRERSTSKAYYSENLEKVQVEVVVKNLEMKPIEGFKMHYWVFAESMVDRTVMKVIDAGSFVVNLTNDAAGREIHHKGEVVKLPDTATGTKVGCWCFSTNRGKSPLSKPRIHFGSRVVLARSSSKETATAGPISRLRRALADTWPLSLQQLELRRHSRPPKGRRR